MVCPHRNDTQLYTRLCGRPPGGKGFLASGCKFLAPLATKTLWFINRKFSAETIPVFGSSLVVCFSRMKSPVQRRKENPGRVRPYVRPVTRHRPLAIMGVRIRVRHQSAERARGHKRMFVIA